MRFVLVCGLAFMLMFCLAQCDEIESDADNEVLEDIFAAKDKVRGKGGLRDLKKDSYDNCQTGFWCRR